MPKPRGKKIKSVKPRLLIYCEGEKTEPNYIREYIAWKHPTVRTLNSSVVVVDTKKNTPVALVEEAIKARKVKRGDGTPTADDYWVVYDREAVSKYSDKLHQKAFDQAKKQTLHVVLSNVCFEYWILLHFIDSAISVNCCDDLIEDTRFTSALKSAGLYPYNKTNAVLARKIVSYVDANGDSVVTIARGRAARINEQTKTAAPKVDIDKPYRLSPYTNMHELLDAIDDYVKINFP